MPYQSKDGKNVQFDVNTHAMDLYNANCRLSISLYNKNMQIGIIPATKDTDGKLRYPNANAVSVLLTPDRVMALSNAIAYDATKAMADGKVYQKPIILNQKNSSILSLDVDAEGQVTLNIYNDIDESRVPKKKASYLFANSQTLKGYNPTSGEYEQGENLPTQFYLFAKCLEEFSFAVTCMQAHFQKVANEFSNRKLMSTLYAIASKLGLSVGYNDSNGGSYRYGGQSGGGNFQGQSQGSTPPQEQPIATMEDLAGGDLPF